MTDFPSVQYQVTVSPEIRLMSWDMDTAKYSQNQEIYNAAYAVLSKDEKARADRFHFDRDRHWFVAGRYALRTTLGHELSLKPAQVNFNYGKNGKPIVHGIEFNLSHSKNLAVLALSKDGPIGIDVELLNRSIEPTKLAPSVFTPAECERIAALSGEAQRNKFLEFWTAKEAVMKTTGQGMTLAPKTISLIFNNDTPISALIDDNKTELSIKFNEIKLNPNVCAIAIQT